MMKAPALRTIGLLAGLLLLLAGCGDTGFDWWHTPPVGDQSPPVSGESPPVSEQSPPAPGDPAPSDAPAPSEVTSEPADAPTDSTGAGLPSVGTDFDAAGPYDTATEESGDTTYVYPVDAGDGVLHPVILWGNGTGAAPASYGPLLEHFASHGFIVAAANTPEAGDGQDMLAGIDGIADVPAIAERADLEHIGATGHSQGAGGAVRAGGDERVDTVFPLEGCFGGTADLQGTTAIFFAGEDDTTVRPSTVRGCFDRASGFGAAYAEAAGASHLTPARDGGVFRGAATAWARWRLAGDADAAALFVGDDPGLASSDAWSVYEANAALQALAD